MLSAEKRRNTMEDKKVVFAYTVMRNEDGSVDVKDAGLEGVEPIATSDIYTDIEAVAKLIELKKSSDAAFAAAYNGIAKFYQDLAAQQKAQAEEAAAVVNPTKE
jgi:hypothetical protein